LLFDPGMRSVRNELHQRFNIGGIRRSPKMKAITPPKLIRPFQRTVANGMLPTEQVKEAMAIRILRGRESGSRCDISSFETISSMKAENKNPKLKDSGAQDAVVASR
jgi:hypothetical protein